jgi:predicted DNA-binding transcriptional regulator AlpA
MVGEPAPIQPRLLSRDEAATYVGLSPNAFDAEVAAGTFPAPFKLNRIRRLLWDVRALDAAMDRALTTEVSADDWKARKEQWRRRKDRAQATR